MAVGTTKVVQVTNIAPQATKDQMQVLFGYLGKIEDIRLYPTIRDVSCPVQSRICYIKFVDAGTVGIAQHMTNTVFIDRALIVIPVQTGEIPDEYYALEMTRNGTIVPGLNLNEPKLPAHVINSVQGSGDEQVIITTDQQLEAHGLPNYPPLPATYDSTKVEETRRTILVLNIDPSTTSDQLLQFFSSAGEVKYLRACKANEADHMLIEFTEQSSILNALKFNGTEFQGKVLEIQHATQPIVKPQTKSNEAAQKEIEEAMFRFKEAQNMINASIEPVIGMLTKDKRSSRRSRSRSRDRRRRRSRSRSASRRSRSRRRSSSRRTRSRDRRRRSTSRSKKRSRSKSKRRSGSRSSKSRRSRSRSKRRSSRDRSKDRKSRARSRDKDRKSRDHSRDRKKSKERDRKSRDDSKAKEKSSRDSKDRKSDSVDVEKKRSRSKSRSKSRRRSRSRDRRKDRKRSRSRGSRSSRRRTPSPRSSRKRSRTRSRDRKKDSRRDKKKDRSRSKSKDRNERKDKERSRSKSKVPRNYDEEEKGFDSEKDKQKEAEQQNDNNSGEKSDNMDISNSP